MNQKKRDLVTRSQEIQTRLTELAEHDVLTKTQEREYHRLATEAANVMEELNDLERERIRSAAYGAPRGNGALKTESGTTFGADTPYARASEDGSRRGPEVMFRGDPWSDPINTFGRTPDEVGKELRGRALTAIERIAHCPDSGREKISAALDVETSEPLSKMAAWTVAVSNPDYLRAFTRLARDPQNGHREFDSRELAAFQHTQTLARAMSLTDSAGGFLAPFQLDPAVILSSSGSTNPIRQIARQVVATSDVWNGVSSAGIVSSWAAEAVEATDDSPTLSQPSIPNHKQHSFIPISIEALGDEANVANEVAKLLADASEQKDAQAFIVGTGSGQPTGIVTALTGTSSEVNQTGTTLDAADFFATQEALGPRFQPNAKWIAHLVSLNRARAIIAGTGLTTPLLVEGNPPTILGKAAYEASFMDSSVTGSASDYLLVYGDFSNYVVTDRIGTTIELVPHIFGANNMPTGQRGWYMWRRVGGDSVNDNAFRMLDKSA